MSQVIHTRQEAIEYLARIFDEEVEVLRAYKMFVDRIQQFANKPLYPTQFINEVVEYLRCKDESFGVYTIGEVRNAIARALGERGFMLESVIGDVSDAYEDSMSSTEDASSEASEESEAGVEDRSAYHPGWWGV